MTVPLPDGGLQTRPVGLDYTPMMIAGQSTGVDMRLLVDVLPLVEAAIIHPDDPEGGDDGD